MSDIMITPETKVGALLEAYPEAEAALIEIAPQFKALKNPVLRRTVARVATLEQAARVAGMAPNELVLSLRRALGIGGGEADLGGETFAEEATAPSWIEKSPVLVIDAEALLAAGETPVGHVSAALADAEPGAVLVITAPFQPAPLIDALRDKGHEVFARSEEGGRWKVWVRRG